MKITLKDIIEHAMMMGPASTFRERLSEAIKNFMYSGLNSYSEKEQLLISRYLEELFNED